MGCRRTLESNSEGGCKSQYRNYNLLVRGINTSIFFNKDADASNDDIAHRWRCRRYRLCGTSSGPYTRGIATRPALSMSQWWCGNFCQYMPGILCTTRQLLGTVNVTAALLHCGTASLSLVFRSKTTLSRPRPGTPPHPENTVLVQGPTLPQLSVWRATGGKGLQRSYDK